MMPTFINQNLHLALLFAEFVSIIWIRIFYSGILWMSIGCCIIIMIFEYISIFKDGCCATDLFFLNVGKLQWLPESLVFITSWLLYV